MRTLFFLVLIIAGAYYAFLNYGDQLPIFNQRVAYGDVTIMRCPEVVAALNQPQSSEAYKKAAAYLDARTEARTKQEDLSLTNPARFESVVTSFTNLCNSQPGVPNDDLVDQIPESVLSGK